MRIAQVCVRYGAPGGAEAHVRALTEELAKRGHEVTVYTSDLYTEIPWVRNGPFEAPPEGVKVVRVGIEKDLYPGFRYPIMKDLRPALRKAEVDVFHVHSHRYYQIPATAKEAKARKIPYCITPHYHPLEEGMPLYKRAADALSEKLARLRSYNKAARVFTVTDLEKRFVAHLARPDQMVTIPNGIHASQWRTPGDPKRFREWAGVEGNYILYAGRLASNKGLRHLVDAFARIHQQHPDVSLVLAGKDWGEAAALKAQAERLGVGAKVKIPGFVPDRELYSAAFAGCRLFALPSEWEAFGIVLLEAMACGKPCVAAQVGGIPEVITEGVTGHLVPYANAEALAQALHRVLSDPAAATRMGKAGQERALTEFDWARIVDRLEKEYEAIVRA
ncbi:MAG TPA: glycosyltransferase family 4 protein [Candidatus Thermoplasmatota archaeon]|nr:glycosyltransferase family 4 protein [Candidatus Thermoplasmatota archaeon]